MDQSSIRRFGTLENSAVFDVTSVSPLARLIAAGALSGPTISLRQSMLPYPQYAGDGGVQQVFIPAGNSTYHAGTITAIDTTGPPRRSDCRQ